LIEKWVDITHEIKWKLYKLSESNTYWLFGSYKNITSFIYLHGDGIKIPYAGHWGHYRIIKERQNLVGTGFRIEKKIIEEKMGVK